MTPLCCPVRRSRVSMLSILCCPGLLSLLYIIGYCQIIFPRDLKDEWTVTGSNVFEFTDSTMRGYRVCPALGKESCENYPNEWELIFNRSFKYVLRSKQFQAEISEPIQVLFTCVYLIHLSEGMYLAYQGPLAVHSTFDDYVINSTDLNQLPHVCDLPESPLPHARSFILTKKDFVLASMLSPFLCPENIIGHYASENPTGNCETTIDSCSQVGKIVIKNPVCSQSLFNIPDADKHDIVTMSCLFSERDVNSDKAHLLFLGSENFSVVTVSLDVHDNVLIIKQYVRSGLSQAKHVDTFRFLRKDKGCQFPSYFQGKWMGSRYESVEVNQMYLTSSRIERKNCSRKICAKLSSANTFECLLLNETSYIIRSSHNFTNPTIQAIFACLVMGKYADNKVIYYAAQKKYDEKLQNYATLLMYRPQLTSLNSLCELQPPFTPAHIRVLIRRGKVEETADKCPTEFQDAYEFKSTTCSFYILLTKARTLMRIIKKDCTKVTPLYSAKGQLNCIHNDVIDKVKFSILFNLDEKFDYVNTHQFICLMYSVNQNTMKVIAVPEVCNDNETFGHHNDARLFIGTPVSTEEVEAFLEPREWEIEDAIYISMFATAFLCVASIATCTVLREPIMEEDDDDDDDDDYAGEGEDSSSDEYGRKGSSRRSRRSTEFEENVEELGEETVENEEGGNSD